MEEHGRLFWSRKLILGKAGVGGEFLTLAWRDAFSRSPFLRNIKLSFQNAWLLLLAFPLKVEGKKWKLHLFGAIHSHICDTKHTCAVASRTRAINENENVGKGQGHKSSEISRAPVRELTNICLPLRNNCPSGFRFFCSCDFVLTSVNDTAMIFFPSFA